MKKENILKLMEYINITPEEAMLLKEKLEDFEVNKDNWFQKSQNLLSKTIIVEKDDLTSFRLQFIKNKFVATEKTLMTLEEDILNDDPDDGLKWASEKDKEKIEKDDIYMLDKDIEVIVGEAADFIIETFPEILDNNNLNSI